MKDKAHSVRYNPFVILKGNQPSERFRNGLLEVFPVPPPTPCSYTIPATPISSRTPSTRLSNPPTVSSPVLSSPSAVPPSQSSTATKLTQWGNHSQLMKQDGFNTQDLFETPPRLVEVILPFLEMFKGKGKIWEACAGNFMIVDCLRKHGFDVLATDLFTIPDKHFDFLKVLRYTHSWLILSNLSFFNLQDDYEQLLFVYCDESTLLLQARVRRALP